MSRRVANLYKVRLPTSVPVSLVTDVRAAIEQGMHPRLNSKGSSGSYFARNPLGQTLGIFKPKDEEVPICCQALPSRC